MLEKPNVLEDKIIKCVEKEYGLAVRYILFLPIGADFRTAVYRLTTRGETDYFLKLRSGAWNETAVTLPKFPYNSAITQIIPPLATQTGSASG